MDNLQNQNILQFKTSSRKKVQENNEQSLKKELFKQELVETPLPLGHSKDSEEKESVVLLKSESGDSGISRTLKSSSLSTDKFDSLPKGFVCRLKRSG